MEKKTLNTISTSMKQLSAVRLKRTAVFLFSHPDPLPQPRLRERELTFNVRL